jgi:hypothetical protein
MCSTQAEYGLFFGTAGSRSRQDPCQFGTFYKRRADDRILCKRNLIIHLFFHGPHSLFVTSIIHHLSSSLYYSDTLISVLVSLLLHVTRCFTDLAIIVTSLLIPEQPAFLHTRRYHRSLIQPSTTMPSPMSSLKVSVMDSAPTLDLDPSLDRRRFRSNSIRRYNLQTLAIAAGFGFFLCYLLESVFQTTPLVRSSLSIPSTSSIAFADPTARHDLVRPENDKVIGLIFYGRPMFVNVLDW